MNSISNNEQKIKTLIDEVSQQENDLITNSYINYKDLFNRVGTPLPAKGKLIESLKRISLVVSPIVFPLLYCATSIVNKYYSLTRRYFLKAIANLFKEFQEGPISQDFLEIGSISSVNMTTVFSIKVNQKTIYAKMMTVQQQTSYVLYNIFKEQYPFFLSDLEKVRVNIGQKVEITWKAFQTTPQNNKTFKVSSICVVPSSPTITMENPASVENIQELYNDHLKYLEVDAELIPKL